MNIVSNHTHSWVNIFFPKLQEEFDNLNEEGILAASHVLVNNALEAIAIFEKGDLVNLDSLVGNYGCQVHAFRLLCLAKSSTLREECKALTEPLQRLQKLLKERSSQPVELRVKKSGPIEKFFHDNIASIRISEELGYLFQARLLTVTKRIFRDEKGYETEKTDTGRLDKLIPRSIKLNPVYRSEIVDIAQARMSESSIVFLQSEAAKIRCLNGGELALLQRMIGTENLCRFAPPFLEGKNNASKSDKFRPVLYQPKTFCCTYYSTKTVLQRLKELRCVVVVKKMTREGESSPPIVFRSALPGDAFQPLSYEERSSLDPNEPVFVCEGFVPDSLSVEQLADRIQRCGLERLLLASCAQQPQYIPNHDEAFKVNIPEARQEIETKVQVDAPACECVKGTSIFDFEHAYCNTWEYIK